MLRAHRAKGQGLVEFSLVIFPLLLAMLSIIEGALLLQSYLAIQHAAREAARFAITNQPPQYYSMEQVTDLLRGRQPAKAYPDETKDEWIRRRVALIADRALEQSMGISINPDETDLYLGGPPDGEDKPPRFFGVYITGRPDDVQGFLPRHPGSQGLPVQVHVYYKWIPLDPLIKVIVPNGIMINGQAEMINEGLQWTDWTPTPAPTLPTATVEGPTPTPIGWTPPPTTPTTTPTPTGSPTPTPTPTPGVPYILLAPTKEAWTEAGLVQGRVEIHNHPDDTYDVFWEDNCGNKTFLGFTMTTTGGTDMAKLPPPSRVGRNFRYLCPPVEPGRTYKAILSTELAETEVFVFVPVSVPDLTIDQIVLPENVSAGQAITVGVVISSVGQGVVSDTFDVDLYVNPSHTPVLPGQPGETTAEGSSPKQWYSEKLPPGTSDELSYVVLPSTPGDYELWAQVDTSDQVFELNEGNNIYGPIELTLFCSDKCDDFDPGPLESKWTLAPIGAGGGSASPAVTKNGVLQLSGTGSDVQRADDGKSFMLHQGTHPGDWEMTVQVLDYPRGPQGAQAGLIARDSAATGAPYAAIGIAYHDDRPALQVLVRDQSQAEPSSPCGIMPIPGYLFDGSQANGEGVYLRIARQGQTLTLSTSLDGSGWQTESCMQHTFSSPGLADLILPGIWFAPQDAHRRAQYDRFRLCPPGLSGAPDVRPKPPLLKECGNVLLNTDFEPEGELLPWIVGDTPQAVQGSADYSADPNGQLVQGHSMQFQLDDTCLGDTCQAWATQEFILPTFISTTQPVEIEMRANLYSLVPPDPPGGVGRVEDKLWLDLRDSTDAELTQPVVVVDGAQPDRGTFHTFDRDLLSLFEGSDLRDYVGQTLRFRLYANSTDGQGASRFHLDQVRCDVCATVLAPEPEPDKVYRLGGRLLVILEGRPTPMSGIEVWAIQLPDGTTPPEELGTWSTYSIQDSTYNMFNLNPGRYRIYAEVWVSGNLYTAATTIQVEAGATVVDVNLNLL